MTNRNFMQYWSFLKGNYEKGVYFLRNLLKNEKEATEFASNPGAVAVVFGLDWDSPDKNAVRLYELLRGSTIADAACLTNLKTVKPLNLSGFSNDRAAVTIFSENNSTCSGIAASPEAIKVLMGTGEAADILWTKPLSQKIIIDQAETKEFTRPILNEALNIAAKTNSDAVAAISENKETWDYIQENPDFQESYWDSVEETTFQAVLKLVPEIPSPKPATLYELTTNYPAMQLVAASPAAMRALVGSWYGSLSLINEGALAAVWSNEEALNLVQANEKTRRIFVNPLDAQFVKAIGFIVNQDVGEYEHITDVLTNDEVGPKILSSVTAMRALSNSESIVPLIFTNREAIQSMFLHDTSFETTLDSLMFTNQAVNSDDFIELLAESTTTVPFDKKVFTDTIASNSDRMIEFQNRDTILTRISNSETANNSIIDTYLGKLNDTRWKVIKTISMIASEVPDIYSEFIGEEIEIELYDQVDSKKTKSFYSFRLEGINVKKDENDNFVGFTFGESLLYLSVTWTSFTNSETTYNLPSSWIISEELLECIVPVKVHYKTLNSGGEKDAFYIRSLWAPSPTELGIVGVVSLSNDVDIPFPLYEENGGSASTSRIKNLRVNDSVSVYNTCALYSTSSSSLTIITGTGSYSSESKTSYRYTPRFFSI